MFNRAYVAAALLTALVLLPAAPALAQGEVLITQAKAIADLGRLRQCLLCVY